MVWSDISPFLNKFKHIKPPDDAVKDVCIKTIKEILDISLQKSEIKIQHNKITLFTNPTVKNEIFLHRMRVLKEINNTLAGKNIQDIV